MCNPHNSYKDKVLHNPYKDKVLHNAHKLKVLHKCTQRRITGMRSRGRRGIKIPHSSDFLTRLTPRPPHHPTPGRVHLVPMHERHLYLGIHIVAILGKYYACRTLYFPEYYETRNITLLYLFCTRLFPIKCCQLFCRVTGDYYRHIRNTSSAGQTVECSIVLRKPLSTMMISFDLVSIQSLT